MTQTVVGLIGAGRMGLPIIGHLVRKGYSAIVHDIDPTKRAAAEAKGAQWAASVGQIAERADFVLICVGYDREVKELLGSGGALAGARSGTVIAILSTIHPHTVQELAAQLQPRGVAVVDSTVCRGSWAADEGTLLSFVGGSAEVVARLTPVLRAYSSDVVHTGPIGTAQVAKAANNLILWACLVADHEALALAQRYGVDIEALRRALLTSSSANHALENWGNQTMAWAQDDMAIVAEMADDCGISLPQAGVVREICRTLKPRRYKLEEYGK
jgi:3-hydroxyisobutyrate dehydrogenase-like beta-hydroxyacid dehydrogenase